MTARNLYRVGATAAIATSATVVGSVALGAQSADAAQCQSTNQGLSYGAAYRTTLTWIASLAHLETYGNSADYGVPGFCWYDNDVEDGVQNEAVDCSGLIAKAWLLQPGGENWKTNGAFYIWYGDYRPRNITLSSSIMKSTGNNSSWKNISHAARGAGDAVAKSGHVFMYVNDNANGTIVTLEAMAGNKPPGVVEVGYSTRTLSTVTTSTWQWVSRVGLSG